MTTLRDLFKWPERAAPGDTSALGGNVVAMPVRANSNLPAACVTVVIDGGGRTRRAVAGSRLLLAPAETAVAFHPGPYTVDLAPFAAAPEIGLRVSFAVDSPDPRVTQQRFDLFLASEAPGLHPHPQPLQLAHLRAAIEAALQRELAQGNLDLPPCTSLAEWNAFRAGFNQLLYMRFGVTTDECVPVDLGESVDFAAVLMARQERNSPEPQCEPQASSAPAPASAAPATPVAAPDPLSDERCLRRLFLELPSLMCALRLAVLPAGQPLFHRHQDLLRRLDLVSLSVSTMPALELSAPGATLAPPQQQRRATHSRRAIAALDEAWALLARLQVADAQKIGALFDDAGRIVANLEYELGERRMATSEGEPA